MHTHEGSTWLVVRGRVLSFEEPPSKTIVKAKRTALLGSCGSSSKELYVRVKSLRLALASSLSKFNSLGPSTFVTLSPWLSSRQD